MISSETPSNRTVLAVNHLNKLNFQNINEITDILEEKIKDTDKDLYLNLNGIKFIDSCAFEKLVAIHNMASSANRIFRLFNISEELRDIFLFTGFIKKLDISDFREV
ncbi:MAG: STAS domain-containing protein [Bacteroidales bacterium]|nr:STAS domain-containing protein [Bacteroidales bacterium]